jgi:hypothetical protein
MHHRISSAPRRADGRDARLIAAGVSGDARPFHCVRPFSRRPLPHRWRLVNKESPLIFLAHRGGWVLFEYCHRRNCAAQRFTSITPKEAPF